PLAGAGSRPVRGHSRPQPVLRRAGGADGGRDRHDQRGAGRQPAAGGDVLAAGGTAERGDQPRPGDRAEGLAARPDVATTGRPGVNGPATGAGALPAPFVPRSQADLARPGLTTKVRDNLAALRVRDQVRREQRPPTPSEQAILARFSSWGALAQAVFARPDYQWARDELAELLTDEEMTAARAATLNAHFTDAALVQQVWRAVTELGFTGGQVLEPDCGTGNFIGFAPPGANNVGVELEPVTAAIVGLLYPQATIRVESFAKTRVVHGRFDLTVGNV